MNNFKNWNGIACRISEEKNINVLGEISVHDRLICMQTIVSKLINATNWRNRKLILDCIGMKAVPDIARPEKNLCTHVLEFLVHTMASMVHHNLVRTRLLGSKT